MSHFLLLWTLSVLLVIIFLFLTHFQDVGDSISLSIKKFSIFTSLLAMHSTTHLYIMNGNNLESREFSLGRNFRNHLFEIEISVLNIHTGKPKEVK